MATYDLCVHSLVVKATAAHKVLIVGLKTSIALIEQALHHEHEEKTTICPRRKRPLRSRTRTVTLWNREAGN